MTRTYFCRRALVDLDSIWKYIHRENPEAADRVHDAILEAAGKLEEQPLLGPALTNPKPRYAGVRMLLVREFPAYLLVYRVEVDGVRVLRVLNAARDWTRFFR